MIMLEIQRLAPYNAELPAFISETSLAHQVDGKIIEV